MDKRVKIIADSISSGIRISTIAATIPFFIYGRLMQYKELSITRCYAGEDILKQVEDEPVIPVIWNRQDAGIDEQLSDEKAKLVWLCSKQRTLDYVSQLNKMGVSEKDSNRLLSPFQNIRILITATEWDNFFRDNIASNVYPEMLELSNDIYREMCISIPVPLEPGDWHLPYISENEICMAQVGDSEPYCINLDDLMKCSIARCERMMYDSSYDYQEEIDYVGGMERCDKVMYHSKFGIQEEIDFTDALIEYGYKMSFVHQATPMLFTNESYVTDGNTRVWQDVGGWEKGTTHMDIDGNLWSGNLRGWIQNINLNLT